MFGERIIEYDGLVTFIDEKNKILAEVKINPEVGGWFSWKKKLPSDYIDGAIYKYTNSVEDKKPVSKIEGSWLGCILFDKEYYWNFKNGPPKFAPIPVDNPLPSDSRFRQDIIYLKAGEMDQAQDWKFKLEEKQRGEAKLRREYCEVNGMEYIEA